jgi:hypothetical protein
MSCVVLAHVKPIDELVNPCPWEVELAGQEVIIDIDIAQLIEYESNYGIWCKIVHGDDFCITKRHLTSWEIINWEWFK